MDAERTAYNALVATGGRPSHPFHLIEDVLASPGEYRDILGFWKNLPDEWQVFTKQLQRWQWFQRQQQCERRPDHNFSLYTHKIETYLSHRLGFEFPPAFKAPVGGLQEDLGCQSKLATWIEYLAFEHRRSDSYSDSMEKHAQDYVEARDKLVQLGVLGPSEERGHSALELCTPSSVQVARRMYERRTIASGMPTYGCSVKGKALVEAYNRQQARVKQQLELELRDQRAQQILEFKQKTRPYRLAKDKYDRHRLLLQWVLDQVPLIVAEEGMGVIGTSILPSIEEVVEASQRTTSTPPCSFPQFSRLPPELRRHIWAECLPPRPTAHFFDVLNHPRKRHMAQLWSSKEFRVAASKEHDSGYRVVYTLLATCRESRVVVAEYYRRLQHDRTSPAWQAPFPIFQTFDWIPADDLIVLHFPPKQALLPNNHAITFSSGPARNVAICLPMELLLIAQFGVEEEGTGRMLRMGFDNQGVVDDETQIRLIPEFLKSLRGQRGSGDADGGVVGGGSPHGGIKNVYVAYEGWYPYHRRADTADPAAKRQWLADARNWGLTSWAFKGAREDESMGPWKRAAMLGVGNGAPRPNRDWWWVGSGDNALKGWDPEDVVEQAPGARVADCVRDIRDGCMDYGWSEFEDVAALGWMLEPQGPGGDDFPTYLTYQGQRQLSSINGPVSQQPSQQLPDVGTVGSCPGSF
jgi:hypothetical protein